MWFLVTHQNLKRLESRKTEESIGEPRFNASAPEGHITANSIKSNPSLYQKHSNHTLTKLVNNDKT